MGRVKIIFGVIFTLLVFVLLGLYWFFPSGSEFEANDGNSNFTISSEYEEMQFYENMRFPDSNISYRIFNCTLQKEDEMEYAFEILRNLTVLNFYSVEENEEISVTCDSGTKIENGLFIAGEGGPTNITKSGEFSVIFHGNILLIRESQCAFPNVAIHELLHVLGFRHSENENNIMYYITDCDQTIGDDIVNLINELYSYQSLPDLVLENVSAKMNGRFLDVNLTVQNSGLANSGDGKIIIYADGKGVKEIEMEALPIGYGRTAILRNIWISQLSVEEIEIHADYEGEELNKENNIIKLKINGD